MEHRCPGASGLRVSDRRGMTSAPPDTRWEADKQPWLGDWANSSLAQLDDNLGAAGWTLDEKHVERLTAAGDRPLPYPHGYLARSPRRRAGFGSGPSGR